MLKIFRIRVLVRVLALAGTLYLLLYVSNRPGPLMIATLLGIAGALVIQVVLLLRDVESTSRELARFLDSIRNADFSQSFSAPGKSAAFRELHESFSEVIEAFRKTRSATEEHLRYVDTVVQHVGIGLISFEPNGEVQLINNAAKRLLNLPLLKNVHALQSISAALAESVVTLKSGESALIKLDRAGASMQLALHAMEFKMKDRQYTLISLQDIRSELESERMSKELEIARQLQQRLLPKESLQSDAFDIAGTCIPAEEVGGDYYDFLKLKDGRVGILVCDVSGKGVPASMYMTLTKGITQACAQRYASPREVLANVNELVYGTIERGSFITMAYGVLEPNGQPSVLARAGHTPVLYYNDREKKSSVIESSGIALGMKDERTFSAALTEREVQLRLGDLLVFYTDGITEAMNSQKEEFGVERLQRSVVTHAALSAQGIVEAICRDIREFTSLSANWDDMTIVVVKKK